MAYIGTNPANTGTGLFSQDTFTGDGSTVVFDMTNAAPDGGGNEIQVFVDNVRQQEGSSNAYTLGFDGSSVFKRITFTAAPAASASIFVLNPGTKNVQQVSGISDNTVTTAKVQDNAITTAKITDLNVTTGKIAADAIDATKLADDVISEEHLDVTVITGHTELSESRADGDFILIYDSSTGTLKKIQASNLGIVGPTISSVSPTNVVSGDGTGNYTFTITGTNFASAATAKLVNDSGSDVAFNTVTRNSDTQITGVIAKSSLPNSGEPFDVSVTSNSLTTTLTNQINVDASPAYVTAAGTLGTVLNGAVGSTTLEVVASDPESAGNVTYEIQSGSLPAGASGTTLHENGVSKFQISGFNAVGSNTTSNFVLRAVDAASNTTSRAFAITVNAPASTSFTSSGTFSVPAGITAVDVLVVAGGGTGGTQHAGGGGAGGLIFMPSYPVTPGGTVTVTVGGGGGVNPGTQPIPSTQGQDSVFGTLTAKGGGSGSVGGPANPNPYVGQPGGSGGGGGHDGKAAGSAIQPTQPGNSGAYGFGNAGGGQTPGPCTAGGGGGGAGAAGPSSNPSGGNYGAPGGVGRAYTIADGTTSVYYAGGGGGSSHQGSAGTGGIGGQGGGGNGGIYGGSPGCGPGGMNGGLGEANKGGGGGAKGPGYSQVSGADALGGGKGVVIVRF
jgi:hypothetical protein